MPSEITPKPAAPPPARPAAKPSAEVGLRVSLIPAESEKASDPRLGFKHFLAATISAGAVLMAVAGYLGVTAYLRGQEVARIDAETASIVSERAGLASTLKDARLAQSRLKAIAALLAEHRSGLPVLTFLEAHTLPQVAYINMAMSENGVAVLGTQAADFETYAAQVEEFRAQKEVKAVETAGLAAKYDKDGRLENVNFNMTVVFDPAILKTAAPKKE